jgi:hypothetical protein
MPDIVIVSAWATPAQSLEPFWGDFALRAVPPGTAVAVPVPWGAQQLLWSEGDYVLGSWLDASGAAIGGTFTFTTQFVGSAIIVPANARGLLFNNMTEMSAIVGWRWQCRLG